MTDLQVIAFSGEFRWAKLVEGLVRSPDSVEHREIEAELDVVRQLPELVDREVGEVLDPGGLVSVGVTRVDVLGAVHVGSLLLVGDPDRFPLMSCLDSALQGERTPVLLH